MAKLCMNCLKDYDKGNMNSFKIGSSKYYNPENKFNRWSAKVGFCNDCIKNNNWDWKKLRMYY